METVSLERTIDAPASAVRDLVRDVGPLMEAAGFDEVAVDGNVVEITNNVGLLTIDLRLRVLDTEDALAYEQVDGIFDEMVTRYAVAEGDGTDGTQEGVVVRATTEYSLAVDVVGSILDSTIIARQRRTELSAQFDYLERATADGEGTSERPRET
jgi:hypothetical protein